MKEVYAVQYKTNFKQYQIAKCIILMLFLVVSQGAVEERLASFCSAVWNRGYFVKLRNIQKTPA